MKVLVTGSTGLVGSEAVKFYSLNGYEVYGIDNNMRAYFFGNDASTIKTKRILLEKYNRYTHFDIDIRDTEKITDIFTKHGPFDIILHAAAQPSHDWAKKEPMTDFSVNANGTQVILENFRLKSPHGVFLFTSTNKVYGDSPNMLPLIEEETRYEIDHAHKFNKGISEEMSIDTSKHSLFGASKLAADIMVQEYGRYFNLNTGIFRCGCITGKIHTGAELHGFLSYLVKCILTGKEYTIFGYKGKQVRDNIHAFDLITAMDEFAKSPYPGTDLYNIVEREISKDYEKYSEIEVVYLPKGYKSKRQLLRKYQNAYLSIYLNPLYILRALLQIKSVGDLNRHISGFKTMLGLALGRK